MKYKNPNSLYSLSLNKAARVFNYKNLPTNIKITPKKC